MSYQETCIILCIPGAGGGGGGSRPYGAGIEEGFLSETELCGRLEPASLGSVW